MKIKRPLIVVGSIVAALIVALLVLPSFIDWSKYQSVAQQKLKAATGYELAINGSFRIALLPGPHATVNDVVVKKPMPGHEDVFLSFKNADVRLALMPLLLGKIEVASITLDEPLVTLVTYADGTNNYTPTKNGMTATPATDATGQPAAASVDPGNGQQVAINGFRVKNGHVVIRDDIKKTVQEIGIDDLTVKADSLQGPFDGDGIIAYKDAKFGVKLKSGGYRAGEALPVQLTVNEQENRADLKFSGVVAMGASKEVQGELGVNFSDIAGVLKDAGIPAAVPNLGDNANLSGMVTVTPDRMALTNGTLQVGRTKFQAKIEATGLKSGPLAVSAVLDTKDMLDMDAIMKVADKAVAQNKKDEIKAQASETGAGRSATVGTLIPVDFALPATLKGDVQLRARGIHYRDFDTGAVELRATAAEGKGDLRATLAKIPGEGNISISASTSQKGEILGKVIGSATSLPVVLTEWLGVVDKDVFEKPAVPRKIDTDFDFKLTPYNASADIKTLSLGEPKITGNVAYTVGARPTLSTRLAVSTYTMDMPVNAKPAAADDKKENTPQKDVAPEKINFEFEPPQLPFDLKFDITLGRFSRGDFVLSDVRMAGMYDGKGVNLTAGSGTVNGGTVSVTGNVANIKDLSGVDMQAGLRTSDLESFVMAMTGKPLALKQKIGDFSGSVKAKGDRKALAVDATASVQGYTIGAQGTLDDPFSAELPGTMNLRIRHPNMVEAIRVFSPGFGNAATGSKPVDISGTAKISGKVYSFDNLRGTLGSSDFAGNVKADLGGSVPAITADITSKTLDVGALVGVQSKSSAGAGSASSGQQTVVKASGNSGQWSREALDTGFMRAATIGVKLSAGNLLYGTWVLSDASAVFEMKDGQLKASPISGKLYGGTLDANLDAGAAAGQALNIAFKADISNVAVGPFLQALTSSPAKRADGTASVSVDLKGNGASSYALMNSLSGQAKVDAKTLTIYGMDIDKLAANIVEAFDGGWKGVLAGFVGQNFSGGQTKFKDISQTFPIANGDMNIKAFRMETTSENAILLTNGTVSFGAWNMNIQSDVQVKQPKDVPVISVRLTGPLNAPQKTVNSQAFDSLVRSKVSDKVQDLVGDKLKDSKAGAIINQFVPGLLGVQQAAPVEAAPAQQPAINPVAPEAAPAPAPAPVEEKSPEQQLLEGVLNSFGRQ